MQENERGFTHIQSGIIAGKLNGVMPAVTPIKWKFLRALKIELLFDVAS